MNKGQATIAVTLIASITVIIVLLIYIIHAKLQATTSSSSTSSTSTSTMTSTSTVTTTSGTSTGTSTSTTCNISCPPGYEVDPLTCECSPLVPANIVVQPNPFFNIRLWLVVGSVDGYGKSECVGVSPNEWSSECVNPGKACMGFHPEWSSCCPSPCPNIPCQYCDPNYGCNPNVAQTSGTVSFTGQVISSNGTPIPNTKVNVKSPFPMTYNLTVGVCGSSVTVTVTLYPPPSTVTTDETGTFTVTVPIKAVLTTSPPICLGSGQYCNTFSLELPAFQFYLSIPDSAIVVPAVVNYNISVCVNQQAFIPLNA